MDALGAHSDSSDSDASIGDDPESDASDDAPEISLLSEEQVKAILAKETLPKKDREAVLANYGCENFKSFVSWAEDCARISVQTKNYKALLKALYVDAKLTCHRDVVEAIQQGRIKPRTEFNLNRGVTSTHCLALAAMDGSDLCLEFAQLLDPIEDAGKRSERRAEILEVVGTQAKKRRVNGEEQTKLQYFGKMKEYINWNLYDFKLADDDGGFSDPSPPFTKRAYTIQYIRMLVDLKNEQGRYVHSYSSIQHHVQALNCIYEREKAMFKSLVSWVRPGESREIKQLLQDCRDRKVTEALANYEDRGKGSHMDSLKKQDIANIHKFTMLYDCHEPLEDQLQRLGLADDEDSAEELAAKLQSDFRKFDTPLKLYCHNSMSSNLTNTYIRGQQCRNFDLCDTSVQIGEGMGTCNLAGFELARLLCYGINAAKTQGGDEVLYTYTARNADVHVCDHKAQSFYLVARFSPNCGAILDQSEIPDFVDRPTFYKMPLFVRSPENQETCMSYAKHKEVTKAMNSILNIKTSNVIHATRKTSRYNQAPRDEVMLLGGWKTELSTFEKRYKCRPPWKALRSQTGFPVNGNTWFLPRQAVWIYDEPEKGENNMYLLVLEIFPFLREWRSMEWVKESPYPTHFAAEGVIELFEYLAIVFLQDACVLMEEYPNFLLYNHTVFDHALWPVFKDKVLQSVNSRPSQLEFRSVFNHDSEMQQELDRIYQHLDKVYEEKAETERLHRSEREKDREQLTVLINQNNQLVKQNNQLRKGLEGLSKQVHFLTTLIRRGKAATVIGCDGSPLKSSAQYTGPSSSVSESVEFVAQIPTPPPRTPSQKQAAAYAKKKSADLNRRELFDQARKRLKLPKWTDHPRKVYDIFYSEKFGEFRGLFAFEREAEALSISKNDWLNNGSKGKSANQKRYTQLSRVAALYETLYQAESKKQPPLNRTMDLEEYFHEEALKKFEAMAYDAETWPAGKEFGKHSLWKFASHLQRECKAKPGRKRKRKASNGGAKKKTTRLDVDSNQNTENIAPSDENQNAIP